VSARVRGVRPQKVLIFGEDANDTKVIAELLVALFPELEGKTKPLRKPPILIKDAASRDVPDRVDVIIGLIDAEMTTADVICVFAHEDCDAVEPAHLALADKIESAFSSCGRHVHAVTPAWEMEAWLLLWPAAFSKYRPRWAPIDKYKGRDVGKIGNAKQELTHALRPSGKGHTVPDYRESDAPEIARIVRESGWARSPAGRSDSYRRFMAAAIHCCEGACSA
jgi:hypothetical protein